MTRFSYAVLLDGDPLEGWQDAALAALDDSGLATRRVTFDKISEDCERLAPELDFIVYFGRSLLRGPILEAPRHGVWSFFLGDTRYHRARDAYFWEAVGNEPTVGITLQRLTHEVGAGDVLYRGTVRAIRTSREATVALACATTRDFLLKACRDLTAGHQPESASDAALRTAAGARPGAIDRLQHWLYRARGRISAKLDWLVRHEQWGVGIVAQPVERLLETDTCPPAEWIANDDRERFVADPAGVVEADGSIGVFVEDLEQREYRGEISYYRYREGQGFSGPDSVLKEAVHLSYPYLIEDQGRRYCVPEMAAAGEVALYEICDYPGGWRKVGTLVPEPLLDSTVFQHEDRWWMFCASRVASGAYSLVAYFADQLSGPWQPHPLNPLSTDIATSRPGGKPFTHNNALYRPAQDCSTTYGGALAIMRITRLTPEAFSEECVRVVEPNPTSPYPEGFHTAYGVGGYTLIDGKRRILIPYVLRKALGLRA